MRTLTVVPSKLPLRAWGPQDAPVVVLLHGFLGDSRSWLWLRAPSCAAPRRRWLAVDLPGHGAASRVWPEGGWPGLAALLDTTLSAALADRDYVVAGYSMGARMAAYWVLHGAVPHSNPPRGVLLESAHPGLPAEQRPARQRLDAERAGQLRDQGIRPFVDAWQQLALFATQSAAADDPLRRAALRRQRRLRLAQDPTGLAWSLLHHGTATMPVLDTAPSAARLPAVVLCGEHDRDYVALQPRWRQPFAVVDAPIARGCGHNVHLEDPRAWLQALAPLL